MTSPAPPTPLLVAAPLRVEAWALRPGLGGCGVVRTGMGPKRSRRAARTLVDVPAARVAIAGLGGALVPGLAPGDVVVASHLLGAEQPVPLHEAEALRGTLARVGVDARVGPLLSVDHVVRGAERSRLAESGALVVDMESAWLAPGANGRPLAVLRVVLDTPGREIVRPGALVDFGIALRRLRRIAPALAAWGALSQERDGASLH